MDSPPVGSGLGEEAGALRENPGHQPSEPESLLGHGDAVIKS